MQFPQNPEWSSFDRMEGFQDEFQFPRLAEIRSASEVLFENNGARNFECMRGFTKPSTYLYPESYCEVLPSFNRRNVYELVINEILHRKNVIKEGQPFPKVRILDIGYGNGTALLEMRELFGEYVELIGYGDRRLTQQAVYSDDGKLLSNPTEGNLQKEHISLIDGNIIDVRKNLQDAFGEKYYVDFIFSSNVLQYVYHYPHFEILKKLYRLLRPAQVNKRGKVICPGGIAALSNIDEPYLLGFNEEENHGLIVPLFELLNKRGYNFEPESRSNSLAIAFQRTLPDLPYDLRTIIQNYPYLARPYFFLRRRNS